MPIIKTNELSLDVEGNGKSTGYDPWALLQSPKKFGGFAIVTLEAMENPLRIEIYQKWLSGFTESNKIELADVDRIHIAIDFTRTGLFKPAVRIDPAKEPTTFKMNVLEFRSRAVFNDAIKTLAQTAHDGEIYHLETHRPYRKFFQLAFSKYYDRLVLERRVKAMWQLSDDVGRGFSHEASGGISFIVPVYNTPKPLLDDLFKSFLDQHDDICELIFSDDGSTDNSTQKWLREHEKVDRVKVIWNNKNQGIAATTNAGIAHSSKRWVALIDHDDVIAPNAAAVILDTLHKNPNAKFLYTDEVIVDRNLAIRSIFLKPAFDPVLLSGVNYVNHMSVYDRARLLSLGGLQMGFEGSQDYENVLRYCRDLKSDEILHLPYPAYMWRRTRGSFSRKYMDLSTRNARSAIKKHYSDVMGEVEVIASPLSKNLHALDPSISRSNWPKISIVIPNKDCLELIGTVLDGIYNKTDYPDFEIIVVDNGSVNQAVLDLYSSYSKNHANFKYDIVPEPFNFSKMVNRGVSLAGDNHILLLNNDIEVVDESWLKEMVFCLEFPGAGIVGAKLLYPDGTLQHAGVILGLGGLAGHWFSREQEDYDGPMGRLHVRNSMTIVTGACMLVSKDCRKQVGMFDEERFAVAFNDVDYCARARKLGYGVIWTPFAKLLHHESVSRGSDKTDKNVVRFEREKQNLRELHDTETFEDPCFSPWYSKKKSFPEPTHLEVLPAGRSFLSFKPMRMSNK